MRSAFPRNSLFRHLATFVLIFSLLIIPWPGFEEAYGDYFRNLGTMAFSRDDSPRLVLFEREKIVHDFAVLDTRMILGNRELAGPDGNGIGVQTDLDTRSIGWIPTALVIALIGATPIPWRRKMVAFILGLVLVHAFILFSLQTFIWSKSSSLALLHLSPIWQRISDELRYVFLIQLGISFTAPMLIWLLVCFQKQDRSLLFGKQDATGSASKP